jgi:hypothetical protein
LGKRRSGIACASLGWLVCTHARSPLARQPPGIRGAPPDHLLTLACGPP